LSTRSQLRSRGLRLVAVLALLPLVGCRQDMHDQAKYEPLEASVTFADGAASRPLIEGTVARGELRDDTIFYRGMTAEGELVTELPVELSAELLARGRNRYEIFCSPCHDRAGTGRGMIVRRGYKQPTSFHEPRLREAAIGYFYNVASNGFGDMASYAAQIRPHDRWAIAAYIRALQLSQNAPREALEPADLQALAAGAAPAPAAAPEETH
jgi:mono/diheme cytochrome c family protein